MISLQLLLDDLDALRTFVETHAPRFEAGERDDDALLCRLLLAMHASGRVQACMELGETVDNVFTLATAPVGGNA